MLRPCFLATYWNKSNHLDVVLSDTCWCAGGGGGGLWDCTSTVKQKDREASARLARKFFTIKPSDRGRRYNDLTKH